MMQTYIPQRSQVGDRAYDPATHIAIPQAPVQGAAFDKFQISASIALLSLPYAECGGVGVWLGVLRGSQKSCGFLVSVWRMAVAALPCSTYDRLRLHPHLCCCCEGGAGLAE